MSTSTRPRTADDETRRRFELRRRRSRWPLWRTVGLVAGLVVAAGAAAWLVYFSSVLAVSSVDVVGTQVLSTDEVRAAAAVPEGEPLARVDLEAVQLRVDSLAAVSEVEVSRAWPDQIRVEVTEREVVAVVQRGRSLRGIDGDGVEFRRYDELPAGYPLIDLEPEAGDETVREVARLVAAMPASTAAQVELITAATVDEITLTLRDGATVLWGSAEDSTTKGAVLDVLLSGEIEASVYDVSVPGRPTTRP